MTADNKNSRSYFALSLYTELVLLIVAFAVSTISAGRTLLCVFFPYSGLVAGIAEHLGLRVPASIGLLSLFVIAFLCYPAYGKLLDYACARGKTLRIACVLLSLHVIAACVSMWLLLGGR